MSFAIVNKTVLVTGANRGLGRALVEEVLNRGAKRVYAASRHPMAVSDERVTPLMLDVTDPAQIQEAVDEVQSLDILINNAGVSIPDDLSARSAFEQHLAVNLYGTLDVTRAFLPSLKLPETTQTAADPTERQLLNRYVAAFEHADVDGLVALLREDATLRMPPQPSLIGGSRIAHFFLETVAQGDLARIRHRPTWANGRPAVTIEVRAQDDTWIPHGISVLEIEDGQIVGIQAFLDPALLPRFRSPGRTLGAAAGWPRMEDHRRSSDAA